MVVRVKRKSGGSLASRLRCGLYTLLLWTVLWFVPNLMQQSYSNGGSQVELGFESPTIWSKTSQGGRKQSADDIEVNAPPYTRTKQQERSDYDTLPFRDRITNYFEEIQKHPKHSSYNITWLQEYLYWHDDMRKQFPGYSIFEDPLAPRTAICYLDEPKGVLHGLTDRVQDIGHLLRYCHEQRRVLFYAWYDAPLSLESFLLPNLFNWSLPYEHPNTATIDSLLAETGNLKTRADINRNRNSGQAPTNNKNQIYENNSPIFGKYLSPYHIYWHAYFRPSKGVQELIDSSMAELELQPGQYDTIHMRVGHPVFRNTRQYKAEDIALDVYQSKCTGEMATLCMDSATRAISCAKWLGTSSNISDNNNKTLPIYFYSDSPELVKTIVNPKSFQTSSTQVLSPQKLQEQLQAYSKLSNTISDYSSRFVGRWNAPIEHVAKIVSNYAHMAKVTNQSRGSFAGFASTFVDLYIASQARCVNVGVGRYAYLANKIGGGDCWGYHFSADRGLQVRWGLTEVTDEVPPCPYVK